MLARLRFNPYRSAVSICSDTLEARLLAYDFSEELLEHYVDYAQKRGIKVNPKFKIPIVFYLENEDDFSSFINIFKGIIYTRHEVKYYTETMHNKDKEAAAKTYQNSRLFNYRNNISYEFLLGLDELTPAMLLEPVDNVPLALAMMKNGHTRMLMRLLRPSRKNKAFEPPYAGKPTLSSLVFDSLIEQKLITENDPIIAQLILVEAYELAQKVI